MSDCVVEGREAPFERIVVEALGQVTHGAIVLDADEEQPLPLPLSSGIAAIREGAEILDNLCQPFTFWVNLAFEVDLWGFPPGLQNPPVVGEGLFRRHARVYRPLPGRADDHVVGRPA